MKDFMKGAAYGLILFVAGVSVLEQPLLFIGLLVSLTLLGMWKTT